ncbi:MAG: cytochrome c oxidase assembly protein [Pseudomonadota bacterium]|nr:cytochrome c oxidase assembly protein [Pseudomonadota bacterium]
MTYQNSEAAKGGRTAGRLALVAVLMFGFGFALVPLYDVVCDLTGLNGRAANLLKEADVSAAEVDRSREVTVEFLAITNNVPWDLNPETRKLRVHPGEIATVGYVVRNRSKHAVVAQAVPSVAPGLAARYLNKLDCFCFTEQRLEPGEERVMPVVFTVDPAIDEDLSTLTLSYTFFQLHRDGPKGDDLATLNH